jgi:aminopeptidase N
LNFLKDGSQFIMSKWLCLFNNYLFFLHLLIKKLIDLLFFFFLSQILLNKRLFHSLVLEPHIENATSTGSVNIWMERDQEVKELKPIILDINEIEITSCKLASRDRSDVGQNIDFTCEYGANNQSYVITMKKTKFPIANVSVQLEFTNKLGDTLTGFYKGSFVNEETKEPSWFVSTQFSPIDCRRAFPALDRPYAKATFKISLIRPLSKRISLSNMPVESSE